MKLTKILLALMLVMGYANAVDVQSNIAKTNSQVNFTVQKAIKRQR